MDLDIIGGNNMSWPVSVLHLMAVGRVTDRV